VRLPREQGRQQLRALLRQGRLPQVPRQQVWAPRRRERLLQVPWQQV
jgi:hypothetical protein